MPNETRNHQPLTLQEVAQSAKETTLRFGSHVPTILAEGSLQVVITRIERLATTHEGRAVQMFLRGLLLAERGEVGVLQQVFFISEAWLSAARKEDAPFIPPSRDPQRKEVLIVAHYVIQPPANNGVVFEMKRDRRGRIASLPLFDVQNESERSSFESPLMEAFVAGFLGLTSPQHD